MFGCAFPPPLATSNVPLHGCACAFALSRSVMCARTKSAAEAWHQLRHSDQTASRVELGLAPRLRQALLLNVETQSRKLPEGPVSQPEVNIDVTCMRNLQIGSVNSKNHARRTTETVALKMLHQMSSGSIVMDTHGGSTITFQEKNCQS